MDSLNLDRQSVVPLYFQIQQQLLQQIRSGRFKPGRPLPSEEVISKRLRVSRMTARQALKSLCNQGVAYSQRGKGTFVAANKLEKNFRQVLSFTEEMEARGSRPHSKITSFEVVPADQEAAEALQLTAGESIIRLRRVRMADSLPMGVECTCLPLRLCPDLLEKFDPRTSLYRTLAEVYAIHILQADEVVEAGLASAEEARLLRISKGSPVFLFTRTAYVESGQAVEYVKSTFRGDRYKIVNRLRRQSEGNSSGGGIWTNG
ncbi:MAG TPA: GntR family transcriptional regulator [Candidatus Solibacter sp.]|nr:GntR family transcriptional regulator [Candidatus Solibacter sp.]